jgi:CHC2 zinc finger
MARIPDHEIERLKKEVSVERLAEAQGIQLTRHGADLLGKCPFHDDRTPSLVITPGKNLWHCLGACNAGGTAIDWVMRAEGISFRHAVELLRADHLPLAASPVQPVKHGTVRKLPPPIARQADDRVLLLQVVDYYHGNPGQTEMTLMQLCLTVNDRWLDATAQTIDRSVFRQQSFFSVVRVFAELDGVVFAVRGHQYECSDESPRVSIRSHRHPDTHAS